MTPGSKRATTEQPRPRQGQLALTGAPAAGEVGFVLCLCPVAVRVVGCPFLCVRSVFCARAHALPLSAQRGGPAQHRPPQQNSATTTVVLMNEVALDVLSELT